MGPSSGHPHRVEEVKIASLLSSATEIAFELGLRDELVAISHECDHPPEVLGLPRLSRSRFDPTGLTSDEIDAAVRACMAEHGSVYEVDSRALARLSPDLVLTQAVCEVCAVPTGSVEAALASLSPRPRLLSLDAHTLEEILRTIEEVAAAAGVPARGRALVSRLRSRLHRVRARVASLPRPRVLALEWVAPPFAPGHWIPEIIEMAGGENLVGGAGRPSQRIDWEELRDLDPDLVLLLPCGYDLVQAREDALAHRHRIERVAPRAFAEDAIWLADGAFVSRSGPRVFEGIEAVAAVLHPHPGSQAELRGRMERLGV
jgi:iron complex transport system substrate-binding protein